MRRWAVVAVALLAVVAIAAVSATAAPTPAQLQRQIRALEKRVNSLERKVSNLTRARCRGGAVRIGHSDRAVWRRQ